MPAYNKLPVSLQLALQNRVDFRRERYLAMNARRWKPRGEILLVGDRPAPDAPNDPNFHFTPFGAHRHSSLWLNKLLEQYAIDESQLGWMNACTRDGTPSDDTALSYDWSQVIALGGVASKYLAKRGAKHQQFMHPQAWKRFHSKELYPLIPVLSISTC